MLRTLENILGYKIIAIDGEIGRVHDFFLDDDLWKLRYLVIETGNWLERRRVLISPAALVAIDGDRRTVKVDLSRELLRASPDVDTERPVSRQQEVIMNEHYGWAAYWSPDELLVLASTTAEPLTSGPKEGDPHLRSFREVRSYRLQHGSEIIAKVQDFVIDDSDWSVTLLVVTHGGLLDSRLFALPTSSIAAVSWSEATLKLTDWNKDRNALPLFNPSEQVNRVEQIVYLDYCGRIVG
jgi:sporulation protein YlmC with PRC-barrel domain